MKYMLDQKFVLCLFTCHLTVAVSNDSCGRINSTDIHIIGFFPCTDPNDTRGIPVDNCDGIERIPIMRLALEEINERCDLLPGYRLVVDYANSACHPSIPAMYHLIQQTDPSQPTKLMILEPSCSPATYLMGEIAQRKLNIPQVAYTASDSVFGIDKERYPRFHRLVPIIQQLIDGYIALVKHLNWNRVAIITYDDDFNINLLKDVKEKLVENHVQVILDAIFHDNPSRVLTQIKKFNARIIMAWIPHYSAVKFWCAITKNHLAGPDFVWFMPGWFGANWWAAVDGTDCTAEEISKALEHTLGGLGNHVVDYDPSRILVSNKNVTQFKEDLTAKTLLGTVKTDIFLNYGFIYDAVWTTALALNSSISILEERGLGRLEHFTYESVEMADVFTKAIANVSFQGISGKVSFQQNGNRDQPSILVHQHQGGKEVPVLVYNPSDNSSKFHYIENQSLKWQGGYLPRDAPVPVVLTSSLVERVITGVASSIGILSTAFFFTFNIIHRKHLVVKQSSYRLNSLILVAVFIGFVGTLLHIIKLDSDMSELFTTTVCNVRVWASELAFVVSFGTLSVKVWRLYRIFFNKTMAQRKYLEDRHLFVMVAFIVTPILVIRIVQAAAFLVTLHTTATVNEDDFSTEEIYSECDGSHKLIFLAIIHVEYGILALCGMIVAYETQRNLPKDGNLRNHHESAVINLTTMLAVLASFGCQAVLIILQLNKAHDGILLVVTLCDCIWMYPIIYLLFVPKVYKVYCKPSTCGYHRRQNCYCTTNTLCTSASLQPAAAIRESSAISIQSTAGEQTQFMKQGSATAGVIVHRRNSGTTLGSRAKVTFSPILEHKGDEDIGQHEEASIVDQGKEIVSIDQKKNFINVSHNEETTNVDQDEKITSVDPDKKATNVAQDKNIDQDNKTTNVDQDEEINANVEQNKESNTKVDHDVKIINVGENEEI